MKYKWFQNVIPGSADTFDLSGGLTQEKKTIALPFAAPYYECSILGYPDGSFNLPIPYDVDELFGDGTPVSGIDAFFPPGKFQGFHTDVMILENWTSGVAWRYQTDGDIPSAFVKISAQLNSCVPTINTVDLKASGTLDAVSATWQFESPFEGKVEWTVFGPDTTTHLAVPEVAPSINAVFPWLSRDSLSYAKTELYDFPDLGGYNDVVNTLYNPSAPSAMSRQKISRMVVNPPQVQFRPSTRLHRKSVH